MSHKVSIRDVVKTYGDFNAVDHISLEIEEGEFFTLLGPSRLRQGHPAPYDRRLQRHQRRRDSLR